MDELDGSTRHEMRNSDWRIVLLKIDSREFRQRFMVYTKIKDQDFCAYLMRSEIANWVLSFTILEPNRFQRPNCQDKHEGGVEGVMVVRAISS